MAIRVAPTVSLVDHDPPKPRDRWATLAEALTASHGPDECLLHGVAAEALVAVRAIATRSNAAPFSR